MRWRGSPLGEGQKARLYLNVNIILPNVSGQHQISHIVVAHGINVVLQVAFSIIGQNNASQFTVSSKVKAGVSGENQQASHVSPSNLLLKWNFTVC